MGLLTEIVKRYSVRRFSPEPVIPERLASVLEAGRVAPSAKNRQAWRFIVVDDPALKRRLQDAAFGQEHIGSAGAVIALCTTNVDYRMPNGQLSYAVDISVAASFMMLQAVHEGLGTCVVTMYDEPEVAEILSVPHSMRVVMMLLVGKPADQEPGLESERFPLERIVSFNHW